MAVFNLLERPDGPVSKFKYVDAAHAFTTRKNSLSSDDLCSSNGESIVTLFVKKKCVQFSVMLNLSNILFE